MGKYPKIILNGEKITKYPLLKRIGYAKRNGFIFFRTFFGIKLIRIPSNFDIHIHNTYKDLIQREPK